MRQIRPTILLAFSILLLVPIVFATEKERTFGLNEPVVSTAIVPDVNGEKIPPPPNSRWQSAPLVPDVNDKKIPPPPEGFTEDVTPITAKPSVKFSVEKPVSVAEANLVYEVQHLRKLVGLLAEEMEALGELNEETNKVLSEKLLRIEKQVNALVKIVKIQDKQIDMLTEDATKTPTLEELAEKPNPKTGLPTLNPK